ncbi:MAG: diacylglycerol kinase family lipid kinase [Oscillospiraceae bacterium]|nr:diacylglycerol kinase family lipid kinase [Oscillospiraceae bacterium]
MKVTDKKRLLLIINPRAGKLMGKYYEYKIVRALRAGGYIVDVRVTEARGDATHYAASEDGYDVIACCGGDGTLNETVTGLMLRENKPPVGYIPAGSTNDFASSMRMSKYPPVSARQLARGTAIDLDLGQFAAASAPRYFTYIASFGMFTAISYSTPQTLKNSLGHLAYMLQGAREIANINPIRVTVETDSGTSADDYIFGAVCNSTTVAGLMKLPPKLVDFSDGLFEIMLIKSPKNLIEMNKIINSLLTQNYDPEFVTFTHSRKVTFTSETEMPWSLDGEYAAGGERIDITNLHNAFKLIVPHQ